MGNQAHYGGNDPERGCGLMLLGFFAVIILIVGFFLLPPFVDRIVDTILRILP